MQSTELDETSGENDANARIGIVRVPVVHVGTVSIEVADVHQVAIGRAFLAFFPLIH